MDVVALLVITVLPLLGIITVPQALAGFSDPNVILIACLFVIGEALVRTGVTYQVGEWLVKTSASSETRLIILLMAAVAGLGAFMSSTGIVAVFIPVVLSIARKLNIPPGRLMMPLSFAGLISGMLTLVATPPNMIVDSALKQAGHTGISFFSFTPIGAVVLTAGILYMLIIRRTLGKNKNTDIDTDTENPAEQGRGGEVKSSISPRRTIAHFISDYHLEKRGHRLRVQSGSAIIGRPLHQLNLRRTYGANIVGIERQTRFQTEIISPSANLRLQLGDVLLIDLFTETADPAALQNDFELHPLTLQGSYFTYRSREVGMAEIIIPPESALINKNLVELTFRRKYGLSVIGIRRNSKAITTPILEEKLKMGDTLLVIGPWKSIRLLQSQTRDFLLPGLPPEIDDIAPAATQAPFAVLSILIMVALMISGLVPNVIAALITCLLLGLFRCVDMNSAYKSIHWQSLILIVGMMPFAHSLESTGGVTLAVNGLMSLMGDSASSAPVLLLGSLFILTSVIGLFISNTATAVLMAPIGMSLAAQLQASPVPFVITIAIAASAAFMTPISSPVNTLVLGPGNYRFSDFLKAGVPFTIIVFIITLILVPILFPF